MESTQKYEELRNKTIPGLLLERAKSSPGEVAYRAKKLGVYREVTWREFRDKVASCSMGLKQLGLKHGERLALMGDPCEEYMISELAAEALGAVTYGIYPTSSQKEVRYLMEDGGASIFVAEDQEYVDRILPLFVDHSTGVGVKRDNRMIGVVTPQAAINALVSANDQQSRTTRE